MIRHQHIGVYRAPSATRGLGQALQVEAPVHVAEEARGAVVAAPQDMQWDARKL
jgi:hypothetical protein